MHTGAYKLYSDSVSQVKFIEVMLTKLMSDSVSLVEYITVSKMMNLKFM